MRRGGALPVLVGTLVATLVTVSVSRAEPPRPSDEDRRVAHESYDEGKAAFEAKDYLRAAQLFLEAYKRVPHHDPLWNAARAFELAGDKTRAANLYSRYLDEAPPGARDRDRATESRRDLAAVLGRLELPSSGATDVRVDGDPPESPSLFVAPGQHVVTGTVNGKFARTVVTVEEGGSASVVLEPPREQRPPPPHAPAPESRGVRVLPPIVVVIGAGLTTVALVATIASGVDTINAKHSFDTSPTSTGLDDGKSRETRTNALFWTTLGLGAVTGVVAIAFVDWHGTRAAIGPSGARLEGVF